MPEILPEKPNRQDGKNEEGDSQHLHSPMGGWNLGFFPNRESTARDGSRPSAPLPQPVEIEIVKFRLFFGGGTKDRSQQCGQPHQGSNTSIWEWFAEEHLLRGKNLIRRRLKLVPFQILAEINNLLWMEHGALRGCEKRLLNPVRQIFEIFLGFGEGAQTFIKKFTGLGHLHIRFHPISFKRLQPIEKFGC